MQGQRKAVPDKQDKEEIDTKTSPENGTDQKPTGAGKVRQGQKASSQPAAVQRKQASEAGRRATLCERAIRYRRSSGGSTMIFPMRKRSKRQTV